jgi:hypothetical protein
LRGLKEPGRSLATARRRSSILSATDCTPGVASATGDTLTLWPPRPQIPRCCATGEQPRHATEKS